MFSGLPEAPGEGVLGRARRATRRNALGVRLTLGYALLFVASAAVLFGLTYALLGRILTEQDRSLVETQLHAAEEAYGRDGAAGVRRLAAALRSDDNGEEVLFRIADADNRTILLAPPDEWEPSDLVDLERTAPDLQNRITLENPREMQDVEVVTRRLPDGRLLQVGISSDERDDVLESFPRVFLIVTIPLFVLALLGGAFMANRALQPVRRLVQTLDAIVATGDVRERAPHPGRQGEFEELFSLFNRMLERIEDLVLRLRGTLDDVAHDLRTPLTRIRAGAELALQRERDPEVYREALHGIVEAAASASATLDVVMDAAEAEAGTIQLDRENVSAGQLLDEVYGLYDLVAESRGISFEIGDRTEAPVRVDRGRLRQVLANLVDNALKYTPEGGQVRLDAREQGEQVVLLVSDTGEGIQPDEIDRIWERHYRGEKARHTRGLGLGLSLVRVIVEAHDGRAEVASAPGRGATFRIILPAARSHSANNLSEV